MSLFVTPLTFNQTNNSTYDPIGLIREGLPEPPNQGPAETEPMSVWQILLIVFGVAIAVGLVMVGSFFYTERRKEKKFAEQAEKERKRDEEEDAIEMSRIQINHKTESDVTLPKISIDEDEDLKSANSQKKQQNGFVSPTESLSDIDTFVRHAKQSETWLGLQLVRAPTHHHHHHRKKERKEHQKDNSSSTSWINLRDLQRKKYSREQ